MKICIHCKKEKPIESFGISNASKAKDKSGILCEECRPILTEKEKTKYVTANWRANNLERARAIGYRTSIRKLYGLTQQEYEQMVAEHNNRCAICNVVQEQARGLHVDHCHKSGRVRGLLCHKCNKVLGNFQDDPSILERAIEYLQKFRAGCE